MAFSGMAVHAGQPDPAPGEGERGRALAQLATVYATQPQGYPTAKEYAQPDLSVPYRWHYFRADALARHEDAAMLPHVDLYNGFEGEGVAVETGSPVKVQFVAEHVTQGKTALRADFPEASVKAGQARLTIRCITTPAIGKTSPFGLASFWAHYRWLKVDVFNPHDHEVGLRVARVPFVLHPGANVVAVKTADAAGYRGDYDAMKSSIPIEVTGPTRTTTLFLDNARMEQEVPKTIREQGRLYHFAGGDTGAPILWPGFTAAERDTLYTPERGHGWTKPATTRQQMGLTFRCMDHGFAWAWCRNIDAPFRIDLPNGRYGIAVRACPVRGYDWKLGMRAKINGKDHILLDPMTEREVRDLALAGEDWDYRPGHCTWKERVQPGYFPATRIVYADTAAGHLLLDFPANINLMSLAVFPEGVKDVALPELGRLEYLLAESWDVSHPLVRGEVAAKDRYVGVHEELVDPGTIPQRLQALRLTAADFRRGFVPFARGLTEAVYPDTIPAPEEVAAAHSLEAVAAPGTSECLTLGLLPLAERALRVRVGPLRGPGGGTLAGSDISLRVAQQYSKVMQYGHHNHAFNFQEHYLIRRPGPAGQTVLALVRGAAQRLYLDLAVPATAGPGRYAGKIELLSSAGDVLAEVPLSLTVLAIQLDEPRTYFGIVSSADVSADPRLRDFGFNLANTTYDQALKNRLKGYLDSGVTVQGRTIPFGDFPRNKELVGPILEAGRVGKGPRGFFFSAVPGAHAKPPDEVSRLEKEFFGTVFKSFPEVDVIGPRAPSYFHRGPGYFLGQTYRWDVPTAGKPKLLEEALQAGKEFWFCDHIRPSKEQAGRFSFGFWLWRLGATGRLTSAVVEDGYYNRVATAYEAHAWPSYYTVKGGGGPRSCERPIMPSRTDGEYHFTRDVLLIREGIDDYRYAITLDALLARAAQRKVAAPALTAARQYREALFQDLALDLTKYYESRSGAYAENWLPLADNPWRGAKFSAVRLRLAEHILAVKNELGE
jgi:hypothetical protein